MKQWLDKIRNSRLAQDSFWAVGGNGIANGLFLLAGIAIARLLGKDLYGEYGVVKTTMFYSATFATFGLGITATKFIAQYLQGNRAATLSIIRDAQRITLCFSLFLAAILFVGAPWLADYLHAANLSLSMRMLSCIIVFKALSTTQQGILSGLHAFREAGINNLLSGLAMLLLSAPLTYLFGLRGALSSLLLAQVLLFLVNYRSIRRVCHRDFVDADPGESQVGALLRFSFPIALQESSFTLCSWLGIMVLTKFATVGDVGIFTASLQWNVIIMLIPQLLTNVVLAHLSETSGATHSALLKRLLLINFVCSLLPFIVVYPASPLIAAFYGHEFGSMIAVLHILLFDALIYSITTVFKSELIATGHNWLLFGIRLTKDILLLGLGYLFITHHIATDGASCYAIAYIASSIAFFIMTITAYLALHLHRQ